MNFMNDKEEAEAFDHQQLESEANVIALKCLVFAQGIQGFMWVLNVLNIFIVDSDLMNKSFFGSGAIALCAIILCVILGTKRPWIKYLIMIALILEITIINTNLTYHTVLLFVLPLLYSIKYCNKKFVYCSYILTILSMYVSGMVGYFWGLCDANMAVLTVHPMSDYYNETTGLMEFGEINSNPWLTLPLYYVLPRGLILFVLIPLTRNISDGITKRAMREQNLSRLSEADEMTSLYNRNKYNKMIKEYYPTLHNVGVIFWDINDLKKTNDTLGHEYGDYLIRSVADSIREVQEDSKKVYRIGGDEFVMVVEDATKETIRDILGKWEDRINKKNNISKITLSASVGYALGNGKEIEDIIKKADAKMYQAKQKYHSKPSA